jgi:hypothetical protein
VGETHEPLQHTSKPCEVAPQRWSLPSLVHEAAAKQLPSLQNSPAPQALPHWSQLLELKSGSTQAPPQQRPT